MRLFLAVLIVVSLGALAPVHGVLLDGYAAAVDDRVITVGDVKAQMQRSNRDFFMSMQSGESVADGKIAELYNAALDELIAEALIVEEFERLEEEEKVALPEDAVNKRIQDIIHDRYDGDRGALLRNLKESGMGFDEFKEIQRESIIMAIMQNQELGGKVSVAPGKIHERYEQSKDRFAMPAEAELSLIVFDLGDEDADRVTKIAKANRILKRVGSGGDFAEIAKSESEGSRAEEGGYRGWMELGNLRAELRNAVAEMDAAGVSDVVVAGDLAYIMKLHDRNEARVKPFDEVAGMLKNELLRERQAGMIDEWVQQLAEKHYVKRYPLPEQF